MERIVYVQDDHFEIPEDLLKLSHEELRERINEERKKEIDYSLSQNIITQEEANNLY